MAAPHTAASAIAPKSTNIRHGTPCPQNLEIALQARCSSCCLALKTSPAHTAAPGALCRLLGARRVPQVEAVVGEHSAAQAAFAILGGGQYKGLTAEQLAASRSGTHSLAERTCEEGERRVRGS